MKRISYTVVEQPSGAFCAVEWVKPSHVINADSYVLGTYPTREEAVKACRRSAWEQAEWATYEAATDRRRRKPEIFCEV